VLAAEYRTTLPDEKLIAEELERFASGIAGETTEAAGITVDVFEQTATH
jgi:hypothetical protein